MTPEQIKEARAKIWGGALLDTIEAHATTIATLRFDLERANRPWGVYLNLPPLSGGAPFGNGGDCTLVDTGYSDRVLVVECPAANERIESLEATIAALQAENEGLRKVAARLMAVEQMINAQ